MIRSVTEFVRDNYDETPIRIAEVGVDRGEHASELLENLYVRRIFLVDVWEAFKAEGDSTNTMHVKSYTPTLKKFLDNEKVCIIKMTSVDAAKLFRNEYFDLVYIDAGHLYQNVKNDIQAWYPKVRMDGVIAGHDYDGHHHGVRKAVDELLYDIHHVNYTPDTKKDSDTDWWVIKTKDKI